MDTHNVDDLTDEDLSEIYELYGRMCLAFLVMWNVSKWHMLMLTVAVGVFVSLQFFCISDDDNESDDGDSDDDGEGHGVVRRRRHYPSDRRKRIRPPPTANYLQYWDDKRFRYELHVSKAIFDEVVSACTADLQPRATVAGAWRKRSMSR
jgi:hypothetical protein